MIIQNRREIAFRLLYLLIGCLLMSTFALNAGMVSAADDRRDDLPARYSKDHDAFHSYQPTYIGYSVSNSDSRNEGELKFQFSVKYEILDNSDWYFGYTQKSFWSVQKSSAPFRETNYSPETFWLYKPSGLSWLPVVQAGFYRHESTGESGVGSHGWDITYLEPAFYWNGLYIIPRVWAPSIVQGFNKNKAAPDNPDTYSSTSGTERYPRSMEAKAPSSSPSRSSTPPKTAALPGRVRPTCVLEEHSGGVERDFRPELCAEMESLLFHTGAERLWRRIENL